MINNFYLILFNTGIFSISILFLKRFKMKISLINVMVIFTLILITQSYLLYFSLFSGTFNQIFLDIYFYIIITANFLFFIHYRSNIEELKATLNFLFQKYKFYFVYFAIFLLICLLPATDPDSLDYHLGAPKNWLDEGRIVKNEVWLHFRLASYGEALNIFSIKYFNMNYLSFLNFIYFVTLTSIIYQFVRNDNKFLINFFISTPILIFLIFNQKPHFLGYAIIIISIYLTCLHYSKNNSFFRIVGIILLCFAGSLKLSFLPTVILIFILIFFNSKKKYSDIFYFILFSTLFSGTIYYKNFVFYGNPVSPFFDNLFTSKDYLINFSIYLKTFGPEFQFMNILLFPIKFFIPLSFSELTTNYGFIFLTLLLIKKKIFLNKKIILIGLAIFLSVILSAQLSNRYYFHFYFIIILFLSFFSFKNYKFLKVVSIFQMLFISVILFFYLASNFMPLINKDYTQKFYSKNAYQFEETKWINQNIGTHNFTTDIRSRYFLSKKHITSHYLHYVNDENFDNEFNKFIKKFDIKYFSFVKTGINTFFYKKLENCKKNIKVKKFLKKRRNFLAHKIFIEREIFEIDLDKKNCLISKSF
jgi:hypothetical protein